MKTIEDVVKYRNTDYEAQIKELQEKVALLETYVSYIRCFMGNGYYEMKPKTYSEYNSPNDFSRL